MTVALMRFSSPVMTMEFESYRVIYRVISSSTRGVSHRVKGKPCEDACLAAFQCSCDGYPFLVLAVADGHGGKKYTRSDLGSFLAVEAAWAEVFFLVREVMIRQENTSCRDELGNEDFEQLFGSSFASKIKNRWKTLISKPEFCSEKENPEIFGTTLAVALFFENKLFVGGVGDSEVYILSRNRGIGNMTAERLIPKPSANEELIGLVTYSLCREDAPKRWEATSRPLMSEDREILMTVLATDGLSDSLDDLEEVLENIYYLYRRRGLGVLKNMIPKKLSEWSDRGVGDDMTLTIVFSELRRK